MADSVETLQQKLDLASQENHGHDFRTTRIPTRLAFVYPGLGNQFAGMGRDLSALWPDVLDAQDLENAYLKTNSIPASGGAINCPAPSPTIESPILGSVAVGALVTDVLRGLGVSPDAAIGYSLGESAALIALRAWTDRDEMLRRLSSSPLFQTELAGPCDAARRLWDIPATEPVEWVARIVLRPAETVRTAIGARSQVYVLIRNTAEETVIGGNREAVDEVIKDS